MHAKDIPDTTILDLVRSGATYFDIRDALAPIPAKVVRAKLDQIIRKGRLLGCACGCLGRFREPGMPDPIREWREQTEGY